MNGNKIVWLLCFAALIINLGVSLGLIYSRRSEFMPAPSYEPSEAIGDNFSLEYWNFSFGKYNDMLANLKYKEAELEQMEQELMIERESLAAEKDQLRQFAERIENLRKGIESTLLVISEKEKENLRFLVKTYSEIPPEQMVPVLLEMDEEQVVKLISQMKPQMIAPIFSYMVSMPQDQEKSIIKKVAFITNEIRRIQDEATN